MKIVALAVAFLIASGPALAQEPAKGNFKSQSVSFDLGGAIAFRGTSSINKTEPAIIVAVSNRRLVPTLSDFWTGAVRSTPLSRATTRRWSISSSPPRDAIAA